MTEEINVIIPQGYFVTLLEAAENITETLKNIKIDDSLTAQERYDQECRLKQIGQIALLPRLVSSKKVVKPSDMERVITPSAIKMIQCIESEMDEDEYQYVTDTGLCCKADLKNYVEKYLHSQGLFKEKNIVLDQRLMDILEEGKSSVDVNKEFHTRSVISSIVSALIDKKAELAKMKEIRSKA